MENNDERIDLVVVQIHVNYMINIGKKKLRA